jgi:hypothetical protein
MRSAVAVLLVLMFAGVAAVAIAATGAERPQAFTLGVPRSSPVKVKAGREACQSPVDVPKGAAFDGATFAVGTGQRPGPALDVTVHRSDPRGTLIARGELAAGYPDVAQAPEHTVWTGHVPGEQTVAICVTNRGTRAAFLYAAADAATRWSTGSIDGRRVGVDFAFDFDRRHPASLATLIPAFFDRAALFQPHPVGAWTYWLLLVLVLAAVPVLMACALRATTDDP